MKKLLVDTSLLRLNPAFRAVFFARLMSVFSLGILNVAVPLQIHQLTGSSLQVGLAITLDAVGMFVGLLCGGVLADRFDRRRLILLARGLCGTGFLLLALNGFVAAPSVPVLLVLACWDGFFGAMGMTALMAAMPAIVGRENLPAAGALSMMTVRFGAVLAPAVGGVLFASAGASWNYLLAGIGTLATLLPLRSLPRLLPQGGGGSHPLHALREGLVFLTGNAVVGCVVLLGVVQTLLAAVRILFPALASQLGGGPATVGLMFAAVPAGALVAAFASGWLKTVSQPGKLMLACVLLASLCISLLGQSTTLAAGLFLLTVFGYLGALVSLLQFTLIQGQTPDHLLGRVNSLWSAQDVLGDAGGALGLGLLARLLPAGTALSVLGLTAMALGMLMGVGAVSLRRLRHEAVTS